MKIGVVCEAAGDQRALFVLQRRALVAAVSWLDAEQHDLVCAHVGLEAGTSFTKWTDVNKAEVTWPLRRAHGKFRGEPGAPMATIARKALLAFSSLDDTVDAVVLCKDGDDDAAGRRAGLEQARAASAWPLAVLIAVPDPELESWLCAAFEPASDAERARLAENASDKKDAKRVLDALTDGDHERAELGWATTSLDELRVRGAADGLADYLDDVTMRLAPLLGARRSDAL